MLDFRRQGTIWRKVMEGADISSKFAEPGLRMRSKIDCMRNAAVLSCLLVVTCTSVFAQGSVQYFPTRTFSDSRSLDEGIVRWYSEQLSALGEPSIWAESKISGYESYRFLWLRTWDHPVSVRIDKHEDGTAFLTLKEATGAGGYKPGKLEVAQTKALRKDELEVLKEKFRTSGFWTTPTTEHSSGRDGAEWVVEAANNGQYHVVDRWSPKGGAFRALALYLLQLSNYELPKDKLY